MAMIDFSPLQQIDPAAAFFRGQEAAQAQQERNMLRQQQMMQMEAQRENMLAQREQRAAAALKARQDAAVQTAITNALASGDTAALNKLGTPGLEAASKLSAVQRANSEAVTQKLTQSRTLLDTIDPSDPNAPQQFMAWHEANHTDPVLGPVLQRMGVTAEQSRARISQAVSQGPEAIANLIAQSREGQAKFAERFKPMVVAPGASVYQPGSATAMFTAPAAPVKPALTELSKLQGEIDALPPGHPLRAQLEARQRVLTQPQGTRVEVKLPEQEKAERGERGKLLVKQYEGVSESAKIATRTLPALETQAKILDDGFKTGFGTEAQKVGASLLGALGVPEAAKFATNAQTFLAASQDAVLAKQLEQKGAQSDRDSQRITETGTQLGNTPEANRFIIDVAKAQLKRDIAQRNFYDKWWKENKTYDGAEDAWFNGEGSKSLFDRAELKKYAARPATTAPAAAPAAGGSWRVVR